MNISKSIVFIGIIFAITNVVYSNSIHNCASVEFIYDETDSIKTIKKVDKLVFTEKDGVKPHHLGNGITTLYLNEDIIYLYDSGKMRLCKLNLKNRKLSFSRKMDDDELRGADFIFPLGKYIYAYDGIYLAKFDKNLKFISSVDIFSKISDIKVTVGRWSQRFSFKSVDSVVIETLSIVFGKLNEDKNFFTRLMINEDDSYRVYNEPGDENAIMNFMKQKSFANGKEYQFIKIDNNIFLRYGNKYYFVPENLLESDRFESEQYFDFDANKLVYYEQDNKRLIIWVVYYSIN